jgi:hypothetical protein
LGRRAVNLHLVARLRMSRATPVPPSPVPYAFMACARRALPNSGIFIPDMQWMYLCLPRRHLSLPAQEGRLRLKCDATRAETRFRLSVKRTSPFKSAGASVQSTGSRGVRISGSNAGYTMFQGSVKSTGYPPHSPVSPSLPLPCVTTCLHVSTGL